jgi:hypothetical protein
MVGAGPGVTSAIPSPSAYTTYTISFPDSTTKRMSPGSDELLNVRPDASILVLFLTPPEWRRSRVVYISPSPEVPRSSWLPTPRRITPRRWDSPSVRLNAVNRRGPGPRPWVRRCRRGRVR